MTLEEFNTLHNVMDDPPAIRPPGRSLFSRNSLVLVKGFGVPSRAPLPISIILPGVSRHVAHLGAVED